MKLNKEQIIHIRDYIRSKGFTYYDLQLEIIDHVACRVEELMTADSNLTLDDAIDITHREFGVMGFSTFEDAMRTSLQLKHRHLLRTVFKKYLGWKFLPIIVAFVAIFYKISIALNNPDMLTNTVKVIMLAVLVTFMVRAYIKRDVNKQMLSAQLRSTYVLVLNVPLQFFNLLTIFLNKNSVLSAGATGIVLAVLVAITVIGLLALKEVARITQQQAYELEQQYLLTVG